MSCHAFDEFPSACDHLTGQAISLRLALLGGAVREKSPGESSAAKPATIEKLASPLFARLQEVARHLRDPLCPADHRIQAWLERYLAGATEDPVARLPARTFVLDQAGLARVLSLPAEGDEATSALLKSYRVRQGVLHNPASDRRTTQGVFHVAAGGLPIPDDKLAVPRAAFAKLFAAALRPPAESLRLPYTQGQANSVECFVSLLLRPLVCPAVAGFTEEKRSEVRFFAPGSLVSNLDFVESIFGNAGDPHLPAHDAGLDVDRWTGHTGCVILAPHLTSLTKRDAGLPHRDAATPRQRRDGMCWENDAELYNGGSAFKLTARDATGVMVTLIADNYYGYCKKEVKTQISFAANLHGFAEEEHAGGALVFPSYELENEFSDYAEPDRYSLEAALAKWGERFELRPEGHAVDREFPQVVLVPEASRFSLAEKKVSWLDAAGHARAIKLLAGKTYVRPSGYRVHLEETPGAPGEWRLVGTIAEGTFCHKPCTVSGGGKSEISKAIDYAILPGHAFVADLEKDFDQVDVILARDTAERFRVSARNGRDRRPILSAERTLGSVIKLLTPSRREYTETYNAWLRSIPQHIKELVFVLKRFYKPEWGGDWRRHFTVDTINGRPGYELKLDGHTIVTHRLRVGFRDDGSWRVFGLRHDFHSAAKVQREDDISASVVVPRAALDKTFLAERRTDHAGGAAPAPLKGVSLKFVENCEARLFQRPDDAIHRGYDRQAEADMATPGTFLSNYEPLAAADARELLEDAVGYRAYSAPMRALIAAAAAPGARPRYFVSSAHPRIVDGKPTKNPRYLQLRPDLADPVGTYLATLCARLRRGLGPCDPFFSPVNVVAPGRRNNPPDGAIRSLAVFNPIHYLDLPELFMEFISSMTGKSPSTTGAGSEGALTKGPFNALPPIYDLNAALVSMILTGHDGFVSAAGYIGPHVRVDHDISMLVPEVFARMTPVERDARTLIADGCLEPCEDFMHEGRPVPASRLGYRITSRFVRMYFGRIFNHPHAVFTDEMLRPELQAPAVFADGVDNIVGTHRRVAESYFADGSVELACPPLRAILHIMAHGEFEGRGLSEPQVRGLFTREALLTSAWYARRLDAQQAADLALWRRHADYLRTVLARPAYLGPDERGEYEAKLARVETRLREIATPAYRAQLVGTLGVQPLDAVSS
jgi:hypothetical protein